MDKPYRRYEILLPLRFNDGTAVSDERIADTLLALELRFGAVSFESQAIHGQWTFQGQSYRDNLVRVFVDVPDSPANREFFVGFKEVLKSRFQQIDIWLTTHPLEIL
jgi:hypothetical protein